VRPLSRGFGGFTLSSRHGSEVAWKAKVDPKPTLISHNPSSVPEDGGRGKVDGAL
jgi:hypothetical protein